MCIFTIDFSIKTYVAHMNYLDNKSLTRKAQNTTIAEFANTVDSDETAHNEPSKRDLQCLPSSLLIFQHYAVCIESFFKFCRCKFVICFFGALRANKHLPTTNDKAILVITHYISFYGELTKINFNNHYLCTCRCCAIADKT